MEEKGLIQMNIQLPVQALEGLSRLLEQLRHLAETADGGGGTASVRPPEQGENPAFQFQRFQEMSAGPEPPGAIPVSASEPGQAESVRPAESETAAEPQSAWQEGRDSSESSTAVPKPEPGSEKPEEFVPDTPSAGIQQELRELETVQADVDAQIPDAPTAQREIEPQNLEVPSVRGELESSLEAQAVRMEPESQIPETEAVWTESVQQDFAAQAASAELNAAPGAPGSAGFPVTPAIESVPNRWADVAEELVAAGPAPLTAEAVSQAFRRDGRRYDNGFPLY